MPQDRLALAVLRAALSPDLNASSLVFSDCHIIHVLFDVSSHSFSVLLHVCVVVVGGRLFKHVPVCALIAVL